MTAARATYARTRPLGLAAPLSVILALVALVGIGARFWVSHQELLTSEHWRGQLSAMADDRRMAIESWIRVRLDDAQTVAGYPTTLYLASGRHGPPYPFPTDEGAASHWAGLLRSSRHFDRHQAAWLVGSGAFGPLLARTVSEPPDSAIVRRAIELGTPQLEIRPGGRWPILTAAPVTPAGHPEGRAIAVVLLADDAPGELHEILRREPLPTRTGESLLVRRDGEDVQFLSPLRHGPGLLRLPIHGGELAEGAALLGREAFGTFKDYRGATVLAAVRPIRDTAFGLVVKIDRDEALAGARADMWRTAGAALGFAAALAGIGFGLWRHQVASAHTALIRSETRAGLLSEHAADAEAALRESESRFKRLADNAPDIIYRHRLLPSPRTEYMSAAVYSVVGYTPEDFYADPELISRAMHPDDRHVLDEAARGEIPSGTQLLIRWTRKDGTSVWTEVRNVLVRDEQGRVVAIEGVSRDVTERVLAERTVRRLQAAVEQSPVTILITDTAGTIEYVNPAFSLHSGYSREEAVGQNPRILKSGHHSSEFYAEIYERLASGREWRGEIRNRRKDGELYWEYASISPIVDEAGRPRYYLAVKENITERKNAEEALLRTREQLLQAQKLDSIGRLAGGVAHDFNNLLGVIIGHSELARSAARGDPTVEPRLEQILGAAHRAAELTRQLLAFSRRQVLQPRLLDLNAEVAELEKMLRRLIGEDVELVVRLAPELAQVRADPGQIGQVLMNLAVNARDAMPDGGTLTIQTSNVELDEALARDRPPIVPGSYVELRVADDGAGMDASVRDHVFEPFFTTKAEGRGSGLGLSTVYGIVKQSGGYIWVDSTPGGGTTFTIQLPRQEGVAAAPQPPVTAPTAGGTETILVVEDQEGLRSLICEMLEDAGYRVLAAAAGAAALTLSDAHGEAIDLLVTDIVMPGMSGTALAERLHERRPTTRALFMSGYTHEVLTRGLKPGERLLEKPFTRAALLQRVREALGTLR